MVSRPAVRTEGSVSDNRRGSNSNSVIRDTSASGGEIVFVVDGGFSA